MDGWAAGRVAGAREPAPAGGQAHLRARPPVAVVLAALAAPARARARGPPPPPRAERRPAAVDAICCSNRRHARTVLARVGVPVSASVRLRALPISLLNFKLMSS
eukprot:scaffold3300_cov269-Prasinococcus_capsulatus_cf.AAC.3